MESYEENLPLSKEDIERVKDILTKTSFNKLKINPYFYRPKLTGDSFQSRHGISKERVEELYTKPQLIKKGFKRKGETGYKYTLCYEESLHSFIKVVYLFDKEPKEVLNAVRIERNLEGAVKRKYGIRF